MNKKIIIGVVVVIIAAILAGLFLFGPSNVTLVAGDSSVTLPSNYTLDDSGVAYSGDIGIYYSPIAGTDGKDLKEVFKTLKSKGKDSGYKKVSTDTINGFKVYEYSANPDKLENVSTDKVVSGNYETWKVIEPYTPYKDVTNMDVAKFRYVAYVDKNDKVSELYILTNNTDADLYSCEISNIVNSIAVEGK